LLLDPKQWMGKFNFLLYYTCARASFYEPTQYYACTRARALTFLEGNHRDAFERVTIQLQTFILEVHLYTENMSEIERLSSKASFGARLTLLFGSIIFLHGAYSTYESVSVQKALGIAAIVIPFDVSIYVLFMHLSQKLNFIHHDSHSDSDSYQSLFFFDSHSDYFEMHID
jgi:hypothetical protein